jgi:hypothetical protein
MRFLLILNGAMFCANVLLYWQHFRFARRSNRRLAALARQVRDDMEAVTSVPARVVEMRGRA